MPLSRPGSTSMNVLVAVLNSFSAGMWLALGAAAHRGSAAFLAAGCSAIVAATFAIRAGA